MKIAVMQPYLFPFIPYYQLINCVDKFVILDNVNFINGGWINRNHILKDKKPYLFTVPVLSKSQNKKINELELVNDERKKDKLLSSIEQSYSKAPFFPEVFPMINEILLKRYLLLSDLLKYSLTKVCNYLGIKTKLISPPETPDHLTGKDRIIEICISENCYEYVNPIGGMEIYSKKEFAVKGISLSFLKPDEITYKQYGDEFVKSLSIIDVIMFNEINIVKSYLNRYSLI